MLPENVVKQKGKDRQKSPDARAVITRLTRNPINEY
jgi:hypothetical protein